MKKRIVVLVATTVLLAVTTHAQTVYQKDRWGAKLYYMQENTIQLKDRWGAPVYYFDFIPDRWQIACIVLM